MSQRKKIMMVAGEASGDLHGAQLIKALRELDGGLQLYGIGGTRMQQEGFRVLYECRHLAVTGIAEVAASLPNFARIYLAMKGQLKQDRPDLVVLIDFPEFNLRFAQAAKKAGIPVVYYITPQLWAWRQGRMRKLARAADRILVIFPFEREFYARAGIAVEYVGNPLVEVVKPALSRQELLARLKLEDKGKIVGLLPGSRKSEVKRILPRMLAAASLLKEELDQVQFLLPLAANLDAGDVLSLLKESPVAVKVVDGLTYDVINLAHLVIVASGTATLETALLGTPMVMVYRVSPLTYALGIRLVKVQQYSLVNLILGRRVVPELTQKNFTPENTFREALRLLTDEGLYEKTVAQLREVREMLGSNPASVRAAQVVWQMLEEA